MDFEKLGAFYLGKEVDENGDLAPAPLLYDAKDLTTHAVCLGMTGSGKTGLCVSLLEEAAIDGIPTIAIDPKGDLANLKLAFPKLRKQDFLPFVDAGSAARKGMSSEEYAQATAAKWKKGLRSWGQDGERVQRFVDMADVKVYTPGNKAGHQLSILDAFVAPDDGSVDEDDDARLSAQVSALLELIGEDADPIQSPAHVFLCSMIRNEWDSGSSVGLANLITLIQKPTIPRVGLLDLDAFFDKKSRQSLAMKMNALFASPRFSAWLEGERLSIPDLLWNKDGKAQISILSIAHLDDEERMFFVTWFLSELWNWTRKQAGTSSLRAIFYMDEVFGYLPPSGNPPSKKPILTLLKQARAFGLGTMLATQNPVDLDYKALSNCGTWFVGRLQTERDVARVADGLRNAGVSVANLEEELAGLESRRFLLRNVHDNGTKTFNTRWALSYLSGPMTLEQIRELCKDEKKATPKKNKSESKEVTKPTLDVELNETFLLSPRSNGALELDAHLLAKVDVHYALARAGVDVYEKIQLLGAVEDGPAEMWDGDVIFKQETWQKLNEMPESATYAEPPRGAFGKGKMKSMQSALKKAIRQEHAKTVFHAKAFKLYSNVGESKGEFLSRVELAAREKRDLQIEKIRAKFKAKIERLEAKVHKANERVDREKSQASQKKMDSAIQAGMAMLGAFFGKGSVRSAGSVARSIGRASKESGDVARAESSLKELLVELETLQEEANEAINAIKDKEIAPEVVDVLIRPKVSGINIEELEVAWVSR